MNWDQVEGNWKQFTGQAQSKWGKLTNDEVAEAKGDRERLEGLIQERYGDSKEEVRRQVDDWLANL